jgi:hypothetical protein
MVDNKSKNESSTVGSSSTGPVLDTVRENFVRAVDQMSSALDH